MHVVVVEVAQIDQDGLADLVLDVEAGALSIRHLDHGRVVHHLCAKICIHPECVAGRLLDWIHCRRTGRSWEWVADRIVGQPAVVGRHIGGCSGIAVGLALVVIVEWIGVDAEPETDHGFLMQEFRSPADAKPGTIVDGRHMVCVSIARRSIRGAAGGQERSRGQERTRALGVVCSRSRCRFVRSRGVEAVDHSVLALVHRNLVFETNTDAHRQIRLCFPVILHKKGIEETVVLEGRTYIFLAARRNTEHEQRKRTAEIGGI